jgi:hypothetical protein
MEKEPALYDGALAEHDLVDAPRGHTDGAGERGLRQLHGAQELLEPDFARMWVVRRGSACSRCDLCSLRGD